MRLDAVYGFTNKSLQDERDLLFMKLWAYVRWGTTGLSVTRNLLFNVLKKTS